MPRTITFDGKSIIEPGAYARTIGGEGTTNISPDTGTVILIDNGLGAGYGGGAGYDGTSQSGASAIYEFNSYDDFARWNRGGQINQVVSRIFNPSPTRAGAEKLLYVRAAETVPATLTISTTPCSINAATVAEGTGANGTVASGNLESGFAMKLVAGVVNTSKFKLQLFKGIYQGVDSEGDLYGGLPVGAAPELVSESTEFANTAELQAWINSNPTMDGYLQSLSITSILGSPNFVAGDLTSNPGFLAFTGGNETYSAQIATDLIADLGEVDFNFALVAQSGASNAQSTINTQIFNMLKNASLDMKFLVVAAGEDSTDLDQVSNSSFAAARFFNSEQVFVWHGAIQKTRPQGGFKKYSSLHGAAQYVGLIAGLEPYEPATFKRLDIDKPFYELSRRQRELALKAGVIHVRNVRNKGWCVNQDINTLQQNDNQIIPNGTSPEGSIMRIVAALNTLVRQETELEFTGRSLADANPATVKNFIDGLLIENTTQAGSSGLLFKAFGATVTYNNGDLYAQYEFMPNGPVNRLFLTGVMLDIKF